jgi:hypothetical protein
MAFYQKIDHYQGVLWFASNVRPVLLLYIVRNMLLAIEWLHGSSRSATDQL